MIVNKEMTMDTQSLIQTGGQDSNFAEDGPGGGGRVGLLNYCWFMTYFSTPDELPVYNFNLTMLESRAGRTSLMARSQRASDSKEEEEDEEIEQLFLAQNGTIVSTPCGKDLFGAACDKCELGSTKTDLISSLNCQKCNFAEDKRFLYTDQSQSQDVDACQKYTCNPEYVFIRQKVNPICMSTHDLFHNLIIKQIDTILLTYGVIVIVYLLQQLKFTKWAFDLVSSLRCCKGRKKVNQDEYLEDFKALEFD